MLVPFWAVDTVIFPEVKWQSEKPKHKERVLSLPSTSPLPPPWRPALLSRERVLSLSSKSPDGDQPHRQASHK